MVYIIIVIIIFKFPFSHFRYNQRTKKEELGRMAAIIQAAAEPSAATRRFIGFLQRHFQGQRERIYPPSDNNCHIGRRSKGHPADRIHNERTAEKTRIFTIISLLAANPQDQLEGGLHNSKSSNFFN